MTGLDWIIVAFAAILAAFGFRQGFIVGVAVLRRVRPRSIPRNPPGSSAAGPGFGLSLRARLRPGRRASGRGDPRQRRRGPRLRGAAGADSCPGSGALDGLLGALLGRRSRSASCGSRRPSSPRRRTRRELREDIQRSAILRELNALLPPSGPILNALARLDPLPVDHRVPRPTCRPPPPRIAHAPGVRAASRSVVRVLGTACGLAIEGSGWVGRAGRGRHQRARRGRRAGHDGASSSGSSPSLPARACSPSTRTTTSPCSACPGLACRALQPRVAIRPRDAAGAILGYPENGPFDARAARIGRTQTVLTEDAYGRGPVHASAHAAARPRAARATPAARSSTATAAC